MIWTVLIGYQKRNRTVIYGLITLNTFRINKDWHKVCKTLDKQKISYLMTDGVTARILSNKYNKNITWYLWMFAKHQLLKDVYILIKDDKSVELCTYGRKMFDEVRKIFADIECKSSTTYYDNDLIDVWKTYETELKEQQKSKNILDWHFRRM